ncbi:MAG: FkbM family methyltransferase [Edaphobacter sp.]
MLFPNIQRILHIGSPLSSLKLILAVGTSSRPKYRGIFLQLLKPFVYKGEITVRHRCYERFHQTTLRISDLEADSMSTRELCVSDIYRLDRNFRPDIVIDGGGNIGLFTLRAAASILPGNETPVKFVICEPLPRNIAQIQKHLKMNELEAEVMGVCLGGSRRAIPFYCRGANESSFDSDEAYDNVMEIPVVLLQDAIGTHSAERILIKLDIEGMEIETLGAFLPQERRAVYIVGELHNYPVNASLMERMFRDCGWILELFDIDQKTSSFRACSPSAVPLLSWAREMNRLPSLGIKQEFS